MALITCEKCGKEINDNIEYCNYCGAPVGEEHDEHLDIHDKRNGIYFNTEAIELANYKRTKRIILISIISAIVILIGLIITIIVSVNINKKNKYARYYSKAQELMTHVNSKSVLITIERYLSDLPKNYQDADVYLEECKYVTSLYDSFNEYYLNTVDIGKFSSNLQKTYIEQYNFDINNDKWNLNGLFDNRIKFMIIDLNWQGFKSIKLESQDNNLYLYTDLPTNAKNGQSYYLYEIASVNEDKTVTYGLANANDSEDKFAAFMFSSLSYDGIKFSVKVKCFGNGKTYNLTATPNN